MKSFLITAGVFFLLSGFAFAAGENSEADAEVAREQVELTYAFWGNPDSIGVEQDIIDAFIEMNPTVAVTPVVSGFNDFSTKLLTLAAGGEVPDVMRLSSMWVADFEPILLDIDEIAGEEGIDLSIYQPAGLDLLRSAGGGTLYGLPWGYGHRYYFINLDLFDRFGIPHPEFDWTVDDFLDAAYAAWEASDGEVYGFVAEPSVRNWLQFVWAYGGEFIAPDLKSIRINRSEAVRGLEAALQVFRDVVPVDVLTGANDLDTSLFVSDKVLIAAGSVSRVRRFQSAGKRFEAWPMPTGPNSRATTYTDGNLVGVAKDSPRRETALDFLKFLRGYEGERYYSEANRVAPSIADEELITIYTTPRTGDYPMKFKEVMQGISGRGQARSVRITSSYGEILRLADTYWARVLSGELEVQEAMDLLAEEGNAVLARK